MLVDLNGAPLGRGGPAFAYLRRQGRPALCLLRALSMATVDPIQALCGALAQATGGAYAVDLRTSHGVHQLAEVVDLLFCKRIVPAEVRERRTCRFSPSHCACPGGHHGPAGGPDRCACEACVRVLCLRVPACFSAHVRPQLSPQVPGPLAARAPPVADHRRDQGATLVDAGPRRVGRSHRRRQGVAAPHPGADTPGRRS